LEPVTATLIGVTIYAEPLTPLQALGGGLIVLSGIVQIWTGRRTAYGRLADLSEIGNGAV